MADGDPRDPGLLFLYDGEPTEIIFPQFATTFIRGMEPTDELSEGAVVEFIPWEDERIEEYKLSQEKDEYALTWLRTRNSYFDLVRLPLLVDRDVDIKGCCFVFVFEAGDQVFEELKPVKIPDNVGGSINDVNYVYPEMLYLTHRKI